MDLYAEHNNDGFSPCIASISSDFMTACEYKPLYMKYKGFFIITLKRFLKLK